MDRRIAVNYHAGGHWPYRMRWGCTAKQSAGGTAITADNAATAEPTGYRRRNTTAGPTESATGDTESIGGQ